MAQSRALWNCANKAWRRPDILLFVFVCRSIWAYGVAKQIFLAAKYGILFFQLYPDDDAYIVFGNGVVCCGYF